MNPTQQVELRSGFGTLCPGGMPGPHPGRPGCPFHDCQYDCVIVISPANSGYRFMMDVADIPRKGWRGPSPPIKRADRVIRPPYIETAGGETAPLPSCPAARLIRRQLIPWRVRQVADRLAQQSHFGLVRGAALIRLDPGCQLGQGVLPRLAAQPFRPAHLVAN